jgi:hypothetical protein
MGWIAHRTYIFSSSLRVGTAKSPCDWRGWRKGCVGNLWLLSPSWPRAQPRSGAWCPQHRYGSLRVAHHPLAWAAGYGACVGEQISIRDVVTVCDSLRAVLAEIDAGRMDASTVLRARIEGAVVALDVVLGADVATVLDRLAGAPGPYD